MKKLLSLMLVLLLALSVLAPAALADGDKPSAWAAAEVEAAIEAGLVPPELQKNYQSPVTRGAVAQMFVNLLEKYSGKSIDALLAEKGVTVNQNAFPDTKDPAVLACNALGIIGGVPHKDGVNYFEPETTLTREQIAAIMNRTAKVVGFTTDNYPNDFTDTKGQWVDKELGWTVHAGIIQGVGNYKFNPKADLTVEQAILITGRALTSMSDEVSLLTKCSTAYSYGETSVETWTYDARGNMLEEKNDYSTITRTYNAYGDILKESNTSKVYDYETDTTSTITYNTENVWNGDTGYLLQSKYTNNSPNASNPLQEYHYDTNGNCTSSLSVDQDGIYTRTTNTFDAKDYLILEVTETSSDGVNYTEASRTSHTYTEGKDASGNRTMTEVRDSDGFVNSNVITYNAKGEITQWMYYNPDGTWYERDTWTYDAKGNQTSFKVERWDYTSSGTSEYNSAGVLIKEEFKYEQYDHDEAGNATVTNSSESLYTYDRNGIPLSYSYSSYSAEYGTYQNKTEYNEFGKPVRETDISSYGTSVYTYEYNDNNLLWKTTYTSDGDYASQSSSEYTYTYDDHGNIASKTYNSTYSSGEYSSNDTTITTYEYTQVKAAATPAHWYYYNSSDPSFDDIY